MDYIDEGVVIIIAILMLGSCTMHHNYLEHKYPDNCKTKEIK